MTEDIYAAASLYTQVESGEEEALMQLCAAAEQRLKKSLLQGVSVEEIYESFICAAGMLAAADFRCIKAGSDVKSFSAGPVSVTRDDTESVSRLREQAAMVLAPWCQDAFRFLGVTV